MRVPPPGQNPTSHSTPDVNRSTSCPQSITPAHAILLRSHTQCIYPLESLTQLPITCLTWDSDSCNSSTFRRECRKGREVVKNRNAVVAGSLSLRPDKPLVRAPYRQRRCSRLTILVVLTTFVAGSLLLKAR